ncbi:MAG: hypothetical protein U0Z26_16180 [Anaerolineales bacterium]
MKQMTRVVSSLFLISILLTACRGAPPPPPSNTNNGVANPTTQSSIVTSQPITGTIKIKAEVWTDNWFAFYLGDQLIKEDSVPITTERSFNSETFTFEASYPLQLNFIVKDFKENDTGLEYIGTNRQQMGDGGFIAQFTNAETGELIAVTDSNWKGLVIQEAPLDIACEKEANPVAGQSPCGFMALDEPAGWKSIDFDDSTWINATLYTEAQVSPKDGYDEITWTPSAKLIWGPDLKKDNTILYRLTIPVTNP